MQECFENSQQRLEQLTDDLHKQLLQFYNQQHCTTTSTSTTTDAAAAAADAADDEDDDDDVKSQLKNVDDAVFSLLRQRAAQRDFLPCVEVT